MSRRNVWLQVVGGWLPVWALYAALILTAHPGVPVHGAFYAAFRAIAAAALLGLAVTRLTSRLPWPRPVTWRFALVHVIAAPAFSASWLLLTSLLESAVRGRLVIVAPAGTTPILILGIWFYLMIVGVIYATQATERAAQAEAAAARSQLAALRAQLNPHFLFNVLHTVVQLIPRDPRRAAQTAEQLAGLLRTTLREDRDLVTLADEWAFVQRYLEMEQVRFGDRLAVHADIPADAAQTLVPSFSLLTLVENAVRHGAGPRVEATDVTVSARLATAGLTLTVADTGAGAAAASLDATTGTGLKRLRERLAALYGREARLDLVSTPDGGFTVTQFIPRVPLADR